MGRTNPSNELALLGTLVDVGLCNIRDITHARKRSCVPKCMVIYEECFHIAVTNSCSNGYTLFVFIHRIQGWIDVRQCSKVLNMNHWHT